MLWVFWSVFYIEGNDTEQNEPSEVDNWSGLSLFLQLFLPLAGLAFLWRRKDVFTRLWVHLDRNCISVLCPTFTQRDQMIRWTQTRLPSTWSSPHIRTLSTGISELWFDGSLLCTLINTAVPGACPNPHRHWRKPPTHAQALAYKYLGIVPIFAEKDLEGSLTITRERYFLYYLAQIHKAVEKIESGLEIVTISQSYLARGMGLYDAEQYRRATFYIYKNTNEIKSKSNIIINIRGPYSTYGEAVVSFFNVLNPKIEITQPKSVEKPTNKESLSTKLKETIHKKDTHIGDKIKITIEREVARIKVTYIPNNYGMYEINLICNGELLIGCPFNINVSKASMPEEIPAKHHVTSRKVISKTIIDHKEPYNKNNSSTFISSCSFKKAVDEVTRNALIINENQELQIVPKEIVTETTLSSSDSKKEMAKKAFRIKSEKIVEESEDEHIDNKICKQTDNTENIDDVFEAVDDILLETSKANKENDSLTRTVLDNNLEIFSSSIRNDQISNTAKDTENKSYMEKNTLSSKNEYLSDRTHNVTQTKDEGKPLLENSRATKAISISLNNNQEDSNESLTNSINEHLKDRKLIDRYRSETKNIQSVSQTNIEDEILVENANTNKDNYSLSNSGLSNKFKTIYDDKDIYEKQIKKINTDTEDELKMETESTRRSEENDSLLGTTFRDEILVENLKTNEENNLSIKNVSNNLEKCSNNKTGQIDLQITDRDESLDEPRLDKGAISRYEENRSKNLSEYLHYQTNLKDKNLVDNSKTNEGDNNLTKMVPGKNLKTFEIKTRNVRHKDSESESWIERKSMNQYDENDNSKSQYREYIISNPIEFQVKNRNKLLNNSLVQNNKIPNDTDIQISSDTLSNTVDLQNKIYSKPLEDEIDTLAKNHHTALQHKSQIQGNIDMNRKLHEISQETAPTKSVSEFSLHNNVVYNNSVEESKVLYSADTDDIKLKLKEDLLKTKVAEQYLPIPQKVNFVKNDSIKTKVENILYTDTKSSSCYSVHKQNTKPLDKELNSVENKTNQLMIDDCDSHRDKMKPSIGYTEPIMSQIHIDDANEVYNKESFWKAKNYYENLEKSKFKENLFPRNDKKLSSKNIKINKIVNSKKNYESVDFSLRNDTDLNNFNKLLHSNWETGNNESKQTKISAYVENNKIKEYDSVISKQLSKTKNISNSNTNDNKYIDNIANKYNNSNKIANSLIRITNENNKICLPNSPLFYDHNTKAPSSKDKMFPIDINLTKTQLPYSTSYYHHNSNESSSKEEIFQKVIKYSQRMNDSDVSIRFSKPEENVHDSASTPADSSYSSLNSASSICPDHIVTEDEIQFGRLSVKERTKIFLQKYSTLSDVESNDSFSKGDIKRIEKLDKKSRRISDIISNLSFESTASLPNLPTTKEEDNHFIGSVRSKTDYWETLSRSSDSLSSFSSSSHTSPNKLNTRLFVHDTHNKWFMSSDKNFRSYRSDSDLPSISEQQTCSLKSYKSEDTSLDGCTRISLEERKKRLLKQNYEKESRRRIITSNVKKLHLKEKTLPAADKSLVENIQNTRSLTSVRERVSVFDRDNSKNEDNIDRLSTKTSNQAEIKQATNYIHNNLTKTTAAPKGIKRRFSSALNFFKQLENKLPSAKPSEPKPVPLTTVKRYESVNIPIIKARLMRKRNSDYKLVCDKFSVDNVFEDVIGTRRGSFKGTPNRSALIGALGGFTQRNSISVPEDDNIEIEYNFFKNFKRKKNRRNLKSVFDVNY